MQKVETEYGTFLPAPEQGGWISEDGKFYAPMLLDGSFDVNDIQENGTDR